MKIHDREETLKVILVLCLQSPVSMKFQYHFNECGKKSLFKNTFIDMIYISINSL